MKWINHKILTTTAVYLATDSLVAGICAYIGSTLPDKLEGRPPKDSASYWKWRNRHRRFTHWTVPYLLCILICIWINRELTLGFNLIEITSVIIFICIGALCHIIEDGICGKVPLIHYNKRIGLKLFKVGSLREYIIVYAIILGMIFYRFHDYIINKI